MKGGAVTPGGQSLNRNNAQRGWRQMWPTAPLPASSARQPLPQAQPTCARCRAPTSVCRSALVLPRNQLGHRIRAARPPEVALAKAAAAADLGGHLRPLAGRPADARRFRLLLLQQKGRPTEWESAGVSSSNGGLTAAQQRACWWTALRRGHQVGANSGRNSTVVNGIEASLQLHNLSPHRRLWWRQYAEPLDDFEEHCGPVPQRLGKDLQQHALQMARQRSSQRRRGG